MNAYYQITPETIQEDMRYLQLLSHSFPTIADASTEIINLEAILNLPKGTEHFLADLHEKKGKRKKSVLLFPFPFRISYSYCLFNTEISFYLVSQVDA